MVSGTDEPHSVGCDEPYFSMQFDMNLNGYIIYFENRYLNTLELLATSKIPVRWPGQCYGFTLSLIFKYCGGI